MKDNFRLCHQLIPFGPWISSPIIPIWAMDFSIQYINQIWALNFNINQFHLHPGFFNQSVLSGPWIFISISSIWALNCIINHTRRTLDFIISQSHFIRNQSHLGPGYYRQSISPGPWILSSINFKWAPDFIILKNI